MLNLYKLSGHSILERRFKNPASDSADLQEV